MKRSLPTKRRMTLYSESRAEHTQLEKLLEADGLEFETVRNPNDHWPYRALVEWHEGFDFARYRRAV